MSEEVAPAERPLANFVTISGPLNGDIICGDKVVAGGTYVGVNTITVTMGGKSEVATRYGNGSWSATLTDVPSGKQQSLTATPDVGSGAKAATESNITVENPCTLVVDNPPMGKISLPYTVTGKADFTPRNGDIDVTHTLIPPPGTVVIPVPTLCDSVAGTWSLMFPFVQPDKGYCLQVQRNDGTGAMLSRVTIGPFEIG